MRFYLKQNHWTPSEFCERMAQVCEGEEAQLGQRIKVRMIVHVGNAVRAVWYHGISAEDTQLVIQKIQFVASQKMESLKENQARSVA